MIVFDRSLDLEQYRSGTSIRPLVSFTVCTSTKVVLLTLLLRVSLVSSYSNTQAEEEKSTETPETMVEKRTAPAIESLEQLEQKLAGFLTAKETLSVFFDYDGTLAPIADNPNKTAMPIEVEVLLNHIARHPKIFLAVISGRGINDVQKRIGINGITYAGNHGFEIQAPDGTRHDYQLPEHVQESYKKLVKELNGKVNKNRAWVEDKLVSLTYHYRDTPLDVKESQKQEAIAIIESHGFRANQAHEAVEAKPPINWNKGDAALLILREKFGKHWAEHTNVIFAGDDTTDEDVMKALQGIAKSFRISADPEIQTFADFRLPRQIVIKDLLQWIASAYPASA